MHSEIFSQYSLWYLLPIFILSGFLSFFLYYKDEKLEDLRTWKLYMLMAMRFLSIFFISVFLLSVVFKYLRVKIQQPVILFVQDNSASLKNVVKPAYIADISKLLHQLKSAYQIHELSFGDQLQDSLSFDFTDKETDFSSMFEAISKNYAAYNIAAMIVASDGIYNSGIDPVYTVKNLNYPVYTIAMGDSSRKKDIFISNVFTNPFAFSGDQFPLEVQIAASGFKNAKTNLQVYNSGKLIIDKALRITTDDFFLKTTLYIDAEGGGLQHYKIIVTPLKGEFTKANNVKNIAIDIINDKKKVLILADAPHPDIAALRKAIQSNKNMLSEFYTLDRFSKNIRDYQLLILYQLPDSKNNIQSLLEKFKAAKIPILFVLGAQTDIQKFNRLNTGLNILKNKNLNEFVSAYFNQQFNLFDIASFAQIDFNNFPPLIAAYGEYRLDVAADVLLYQKIKGVKTNKPLIFIFSTEQNDFIRNGFICGENIWRWRMEDYAEHKNHEQFDALINRLLHYLSLDIKKERFRVFTKRIFKENEAVIIRAEYYNKSYELNNKAEIKLALTNSKNERFDYNFLPKANTYILDLGQLPVGHYSYHAVLHDGQESFTKNASFLIMPVELEQINTRADYALMQRIATETGAQMFTSENISALADSIQSNNNIQPISFTSYEPVDLIDIKYLFFIILLLLSAEWFLRKFWGTY